MKSGLMRIAGWFFCQCGKLGVDGDEFYVRVIGNEKDFELVKKYESKV